MSRLGVGFIGSGFNTRFHIQSWQQVRDGDVLGVWSPNAANAASAAKLSRDLGCGDARGFKSIAEMVADPAIDAIWLCGPNQARIENIEEICDAIARGKGTLKGIACEKPLARTVAEATTVLKMVEKVGLKHGYLENQLFSPGIVRGRELIWARGAKTTGRPYLSRAAEEHSGPHAAWFWDGTKQGGGVLNDMMCHSVEVVRFLLTEPGRPRSSLTPVCINGRIASLKWSRPEYAKQLKARYGKQIDYTKRPSEDFAGVTITYETETGERVIGEASTSWSFVGAGLRLSGELLGPEYSMNWNTLNSELNCFFSREVQGAAGEDLVEKQNAEMGLMPVVPDEASAYGYAAENRHFCRVFLDKEGPLLTFEDGVDVMRILMSAYKSAEEGKSLAFPPRGLDKFVPAVAKGTWRG
ncbi:MAG: Gfo/Idh/MocA family oxidoreductase [Gemmatimonadales bacterium]|nr:Gfo/Idh/MocA family oxidoreductase [Gemmatimonadales bacterium]